MQNIYNAPDKEKLLPQNLTIKKRNGRRKYPYAILFWRSNWDDMTVFFQFLLKIKK